MTAEIRNDKPHRVEKPFFTFGMLTLLIFMGIGYAFGITRMVLGLGSVTNLDNHNPWGIWISFDVACGVALAAGGFTTAALVEISPMTPPGVTSSGSHSRRSGTACHFQSLGLAHARAL